MPLSRLSDTSWRGCGLWVAAFLVVVVGGCVAGLALRPDPDAPARVAEGDGWKVQVRKDDVGDPCTELIIGNAVRTGQCGFAVATEGAEPGVEAPAVYRATSAEVGGGTIVIFGPVPEGAVRVRLRLADGSRPVVPIEERGRSLLRARRPGGRPGTDRAARRRRWRGATAVLTCPRSAG
ncbi:MAG: hypothetical protein WKF43_02280 [Acidimicrobiales bacterium]